MNMDERNEISSADVEGGVAASAVSSTGTSFGVAAVPSSAIRRCRIVVAGVGGGACGVLGRALRDWPDPPVVAAINTDATSLAECGVELSILVGKTVAKGMGAGGDVEIGRLAANEDIDAFRSLVAGHDLLLMLVGLGGGAGTGIAPVLARVAREEGVLVMAYVTLPFDFEGTRRQEQAQEGLESLKAACDTVVCLPNQRLSVMLPKETPVMEAFAFTDRMMLSGLRGLWTLLAQNNSFNLDFSDLQTLVENSGNVCCFGYGEGTGPEKAEQALEALLNGPMLESGRVLANSRAMILSVMGGSDLSLSEIDQVQQRVRGVARNGARIAFGAAVLPGWEGRLALTILAVEHWMPPAPGGTGSLFLDEPPATEAPAASGARGRRGHSRQTQLPLDASNQDRGRFKNMEPTLHDGSDLDIPTFLRQGVRIPS